MSFQRPHAIAVWSALAVVCAAPPAAAQGEVLWERKISASTGGFSGDLDSYDQFGKSCTPIGDLDGDGIGDLAVGAYRDDDGGLDHGAVWVLFMEADGTVRDEQKISDTAGGFGGELGESGGFGISVSLLGDLDGDGRPELAIGAHGDDDGGINFGAVWIVSLSSDGSVHAETKISATTGGLTAQLDPYDYFGLSVAALGDIDGDGVPDLAAGAVRDDDGAPDNGAVHILFLTVDGSVKAEQKISATAGEFDGALESFGMFGASVVSLGDIDGNGVPDLAVGAPRESGGGVDRGGVWLLFLESDGTVKAHRHIGDSLGGLIGPLQDDDWFGTGVAALGDLNGDQFVDLAVGCGFNDDGAEDSGAVFILFLNADSTVGSEQKISAISGGFGGTLETSDIFGWSTVAVGDVDGDGLDDLAVGANRDDDGGINQGALWLLGLDPGPWSNLGGGTLGMNGNPTLVGAGQLATGTPLSVTLSNALPFAPSLLWLAFSSTPLQKFGGILHAFPPDAQFLLPADGAGTVSLSANMPAGVPPGSDLFFQFLCQDASLPSGISLSNSVVGTTP